MLDGGDDDTLSTRRSIEQSGEIESLTDSLIDGLYKQIKTNEKKQKMEEQGPKAKKATNFVGSKKQVVTFEKSMRPAQPKKPSAKSRLFDYES